MDSLTPEENEVLGHLVAAWNAFIKLPKQHPSHNIEFCHKMNDLQRMIMSRPTARAQGLPAEKMGHKRLVPVIGLDGIVSEIPIEDSGDDDEGEYQPAWDKELAIPLDVERAKEFYAEQFPEFGKDFWESAYLQTENDLHKSTFRFVTNRRKGTYWVDASKFVEWLREQSVKAPIILGHTYAGILTSIKEAPDNHVECQGHLDGEGLTHYWFILTLPPSPYLTIPDGENEIKTSLRVLVRPTNVLGDELAVELEGFMLR